jgi:hypothetical protein
MPSRSRRTGIVATLAHLRGRGGRRAPATRLLLLALVLALCALGFGVASATAEAPQVTTPEVSEVSYTTAHVKAKIDRGGEGTGWFFEVSTDGSNWERTNVEGFTEEGTGLQTVQGDITNLNYLSEGLKPGTTYQIRLNASNGSGTTLSPEPNPEFTTKTLPAPTVTIDPVTTFAGNTATFSGQIDPNPPAGNPPASDVAWHFECSPACPNVESGTVPAGATGSGQEVEAEATGLEGNTTYEVTLVGKNAGDPVSAGPVSFTTDEVAPDAQTIPAFVLEGGTSALLGARINPHNSATTYWFNVEGPGGTVVVPATKDASAGNGSTGQILTQKVSSLTAGATYHVQVVATSAGGQSEGNSVPLTIPTPAPAEGECGNKVFRVGPSAPLPDCRAFELTSLPDILGYSITAPHPGLTGSNAIPFSAVAADGNAAIWATNGFLPGADSDGQWDTYISRRTSAGWTREFVTPPASKRPLVPQPSLLYADPNLTRTVWRVEKATIDPTDPDIGQAEPGTYPDLFRRETDGSFVRLTKGPAEQTSPNSIDLRATFSRDAMWSAFTWQGSALVSDGGEPSTNDYVGNGATIHRLPPPTGGTVFGVSEDGGTVGYNDKPGYGLRLWTDGLTKPVTVAESPSGGIHAERLSGDGNTLLYSSPNQETSDDTDQSSDLYEFDVATETKRRISAPSGNPSGPGPGNEKACFSPPVHNAFGELICEPMWLAASDDSSHAYFISPELLSGDRGVSGAVNLYLRSGGQTSYVTTLDPADHIFGGHELENQISIGSAFRSVQLTPDQSKLIFESRARVTAYNNAGLSEIYLYDPATDEITCASCRLDGSAPKGEALLRLNVGDTTIRSTPEEPIEIVASNDSGSEIFFATYDSLRPGDTDENSDVYAANLQHGQISILGNQTGDSNNFFWGAGANGRDVFISSSSALSPEEHSVGAYKLYDARIGGGFASAPPDPGQTCEGDSCRGPASPATPGAAPAQLQGPGNPPVKHKKKHKRHHKKHKGHHKHRKAKKHGEKRRAGDNGRTH